MVTIKELAKLTGFSTTTISNVIHGKTHKVSPDNIQKIRKAIKDTNYIPRMGLSSLTNKKSHIIGVVIHIQKYYEETIIADPFYATLLGFLEKYIRESGYFMMLYTSEDLESIFKMAVSWNVDGLIAISAVYETYQRLNTLTKKPIVAIDMYGARSGNFVNVGIDDFSGGYKMTMYLISQGFRKITVLANSDFGVDHQRIKGYKAALFESAIPLQRDFFILLAVEREKRIQTLRALIPRIHSDQALFFLSDVYASEAIHFFQGEGIRVPEDISIVGFDDNLYARLTIPQLTSVHQEVKAKAKTALQLIDSMISNKNVVESNILLPISLAIRGSVRPIS
jgi:DNA-binding LacI/PurR family transcriptional regulator